MSVDLTEEQLHLIKNIAENEDFSEYQIDAKSGTMKGDGYLGIITTIDITDGKRKLNLILKSAETNEAVRNRMPIRDAYLKEIFMYERVFPEFHRFQRQNGLTNGFSGTAKLYGSCAKENNECLLLENLRELGYKLWNRKVPMNAEHVAMVIAEYGKFHAVSLAMKHKEPETYRNLTNKLMNFKNMFNENARKRLAERLFKNGLRATEGNNKAKEAMEKFTATFEKFSSDDLEFSNDHIVIAHGDCWCNNMMFTYEDPEDLRKPKEVCLLDWQLSKISSPVVDLSYFFFACSSKEIIDDYKRYLTIYHNSVSKTLESLSCDVKMIFPFSMLEYHWNKYCKFGLFAALLVIKVALIDSEETSNITETEKFGQTFFGVDGVKSSIIDEYNQRIVDILSVLSENKFI